MGPVNLGSQSYLARFFANGGGAIPASYKDYAVTFPHRTIREAAIMELARQHGFRCVTRIAEDSANALPYAGKVYGMQLVFLR